MTKEEFLLYAKDYFKNDRVNVVEANTVLELQNFLYRDELGFSTNGCFVELVKERGILNYGKKIELLLGFGQESRYNVFTYNKYGIDLFATKVGKYDSNVSFDETNMNVMLWCNGCLFENYNEEITVPLPDRQEVLSNGNLESTAFLMQGLPERNQFKDIVFESGFIMSKSMRRSMVPVKPSKLIIEGYKAILY